MNRLPHEIPIQAREIARKHSCTLEELYGVEPTDSVGRVKTERKEFIIVGSTLQPWEGATLKPGDKITFDVPVYNWHERFIKKLRVLWFIWVVWPIREAFGRDYD